MRARREPSRGLPVPPSSEMIDGDRKEPRPSTLDERHGPTPAAAGALNLMGKQATLKPVGRRILSRLAGFSIWQYSRSIPAKWASQIIRPSPVSRNSLAMSSNFRSNPITLIPCSTSQSVDSRVIPGCSKYSVLPRPRSRPFMITTISKGLSAYPIPCDLPPCGGYPDDS
jgi:hypothetical protein